MDLDFTTKGVVKVSMDGYIEEMPEGFFEHIAKPENTCAADHLLEVNPKGKQISKARAQLFHRHVVKLIFIRRQLRPNIQATPAFLTTFACNHHTKTTGRNWSCSWIFSNELWAIVRP